MSEKNFKIVGDDISDGYHTFAELYDHRIALFCYAIRHGAFLDAFIVYEHYPGWDAVVCKTYSGEQISYHIPTSSRKLIAFLPAETETNWDGHTSAQVVERLNEGKAKAI